MVEMFNVILSIVAVTISVTSFILSIVFYSWGSKQLRNVQELNLESYRSNIEVLSEIKRIIDSIKDTSEETKSKLLDIILDVQNKHIDQRFDELFLQIDSVKDGDIKSSINELKENSKTEIRKETTDEIYNLINSAKLLNGLNKIQIKILFVIWESQITQKSISKSDLIELTNESKDIINTNFDVLEKLGLIEDMEISKTHIESLYKIFDVEDYPGMNLDERINTIKELITRIIGLK